MKICCHIFFTITFLTILFTTDPAMSQERTYAFKQFGSKYVVSVKNRSEIVKSLTDFCIERKIKTGSITGLGAIDEATLRFFNPETKNFVDKTFSEQMEISNLTGNISTMDGKEYLHIHATLGREDYSALAGHLLSARLKGAGEFFIETADGITERSFDSITGLNLYDFEKDVNQQSMQQLPQEKTIAHLEQVFTFSGAMPTGVTVSEDGRVFICFPDWGDKLDFTVAEIVDKKLVPYPSAEANKFDNGDPTRKFHSVQSVVADKNGTLWVLDTAAPKFSAPNRLAAKLVAVDLNLNRIKRVYTFEPDVLLETTYLNDVRVDYRVGKNGYAYITDSSISPDGPGALIVLDLDSGKSFRRLNGHQSTSADTSILPKIEGQVLMKRNPDGSTSPALTNADGIAISPDGTVLYYCPLTSRRLYSIETAKLHDTSLSDQALAAHVKDLGEKGMSDGMITDANNVIYAGDLENNGIRAIMPDGSMKTIVHDPRALWPDTLSIGPNGYLYFIANQLHRQAGFHYGKDMREKPYSLFRVKIDALPAPTK